MCEERRTESNGRGLSSEEYTPKGLEAISAGTVSFSNRPACSRSDMSQIGIDISNQKPKEMTQDMIRIATTIVNMGCMDDKYCPALFLTKVIDWGLKIEKISQYRR